VDDEQKENGEKKDNAKKSSKKDKPKGRNLLGKGANAVSLIILCYGMVIAQNFRSILYPTFPDIDPRTNKYLDKWGNVINTGDTCHVRLWLEASGQKTLLSEFDFIYDSEVFQPWSMKFNASTTKAQLLKGNSVHLRAEVQHKGRQIEAKGSVIKKMKKPDVRPKFKLLENTQCPEEEEPYWGKKKTHIGRGIPQMQVRLVFDDTLYPWRGRAWYPDLFVDEFWMTDDQLVKLNHTGTSTFESEAHFNLMSAPRRRFQLHMERAFESNAKIFGEDGEEMLQMRDLFANTSPKLLIATFVVSFLHLIFEVLAFKNDVSFWQSCSPDTLNKYMSVQSIVVGIVMQSLLLIYLWDEGSNIIVLITSLAAILIDVWKVQRAMKIAWVKVFGFLPLPTLASKVKKEKADDFDGQAMRWLALALSPGIVGYGIYTMSFECHRSWYSLFLHFTASCVYSLGFVLMTPQVFINYKYKTVAFLPWRKFIYRAINTFIDDLFAFIIRMPTMHRLSCFRDDIVFVIYLVQRWQYPVDKNRTFDEDGYELGDDEDADEKKKQ